MIISLITFLILISFVSLFVAGFLLGKYRGYILSPSQIKQINRTIKQPKGAVFTNTEKSKLTDEEIAENKILEKMN